MTDDYVTFALLVSTAFFVALSFGLLYRYRQVSRKMTESSDLGRDLWASLEQRLRKQDERIIDLMARFDVIQSRTLATSMANPSPEIPPEARPAEPSKSPSSVEVAPEPPTGPGDTAETTQLGLVARPTESQESRPRLLLKLDETELAAIQSLRGGALSTVKILEALRTAVKITRRETAARTMKNLFDMGLVSRDDSARPFVYQLTEEGRRYLP